MKKQILSLTCALTLLLTGNGNSLTVEAAKKPISLSNKSINLKVGETKKLNVKKTAKVKIRSKIFTSSNKKVASVTKKTGKIKAKKAGKATISVKVKYSKKPEKKKQAITLKCKVTITDKNASAKSNEATATSQTSSSSNVALPPLPTEDNGGTMSVSDSASPEPSDKTITGGEPTEEPKPGKDRVIETTTFDGFAQAAAKLVKDNKSSNGSSIAASDEFYTKRLIVKGKDENLSFETYKPTTVVKSSDNIFMVQFETTSDAKKAMSELSDLPNVEYVEADSYSGSSIDVESSKVEHKSWGVSKIGADQYAKTVVSDEKQEVEVAVVDTGVSSHPFLEGRISDKGMDFVDIDEMPNDLNSHGTHVAGTIVDCTPNLGVKILPVRVLDEDGSGYSSIVGMGIRYAVNCGAKVINLSLGGKHSQYLDDNIDYAIKKGVTVVVASGNEYGNTSNYCPSHIADAIVVGAVDENDNRASFSNIGSSLDVVAPGVDIVSCVPGGGYKSYRGTSMAAPHVSAIAAMFTLMYPEKRPAEIEEMIQGCTRDLGEPGWDKQYGHGIPDLKSLCVAPAEIILDQYSLTMNVGNIEMLTASVLPENAGNKAITWSSSDDSIASVQDGAVIAKAVGNAVITAETSNGIMAACNVVVFPGMQEAGLYDGETMKMKKSWEKLIGDGVIVLSEDGKTILSADTQGLFGILVIADGVTDIGSNTFYGCEYLSKIMIPDSVTAIGEKAFYHVPVVIYDGPAEGKSWGADSVKNSYGTSESIFAMGSKKFALGMSRADINVILGGSSSQETYTGMAPQGFDTISYHSDNYDEYLLIYLRDDRVVGICGIGKTMSFYGAEVGENGNNLDSNWRDMSDYRTSSGKISAKKIAVSGSEQAYAFYDTLGNNDIYCIQVFDPTQLADADHDMIYRTDNLSYSSEVNNSIAKEVGHMLNAFRVYRLHRPYYWNDRLAQCAQDYCNTITAHRIKSRDADYLLNILLSYNVDPLNWGETCYYDASDAISFANSLIELDDFYYSLLNSETYYYIGVGMAFNSKHAYLTIDYVDEI